MPGGSRGWSHPATARPWRDTVVRVAIVVLGILAAIALQQLVAGTRN